MTKKRNIYISSYIGTTTSYHTHSFATCEVGKSHLSLFELYNITKNLQNQQHFPLKVELNVMGNIKNQIIHTGNIYVTSFDTPSEMGGGENVFNDVVKEKCESLCLQNNEEYNYICHNIEPNEKLYRCLVYSLHKSLLLPYGAFPLQCSKSKSYYRKEEWWINYINVICIKNGVTIEDVEEYMSGVLQCLSNGKFDEGQKNKLRFCEKFICSFLNSLETILDYNDDNVVNTKTSKIEDLDLFTKAKITLSGDCEDLAESIYENYIELINTTSNDVLMKLISRLLRFYIPCMTQGVVSVCSAVVNNNIEWDDTDLHTYISLIPLSSFLIMSDKGKTLDFGELNRININLYNKANKNSNTINNIISNNIREFIKSGDIPNGDVLNTLNILIIDGTERSDPHQNISTNIKGDYLITEVLQILFEFLITIEIKKGFGKIGNYMISNSHDYFTINLKHKSYKDCRNIIMTIVEWAKENNSNYIPINTLNSIFELRKIYENYSPFYKRIVSLSTGYFISNSTENNKYTVPQELFTDFHIFNSNINNNRHFVDYEQFYLNNGVMWMLPCFSFNTEMLQIVYSLFDTTEQSPSLNSIISTEAGLKIYNVLCMIEEENKIELLHNTHTDYMKKLGINRDIQFALNYYNYVHELYTDILLYIKKWKITNSIEINNIYYVYQEVRIEEVDSRLIKKLNNFVKEFNGLKGSLKLKSIGYIPMYYGYSIVPSRYVITLCIIFCFENE